MQGSIEEVTAGDSESFDLWYSYWRGMFPAVDEAAIAAFEVSYHSGNAL